MSGRTGLQTTDDKLRTLLKVLQVNYNRSPGELSDAVESLARVSDRLLDRIEVLEARLAEKPAAPRAAAARATAAHVADRAPSPRPDITGTGRRKSRRRLQKGSLAAAIADTLDQGGWWTSGELVTTLQRQDLPQKVNSTSVTVTLGRLVERGHAVRRYRQGQLFEYSRSEG